jgi:hypothetical protein
MWGFLMEFSVSKSGTTFSVNTAGTMNFSTSAGDITFSVNRAEISVTVAGPTVSMTEGPSESEPKYVLIDGEKLAIDGEYITTDKVRS